MHRFNTAYLSVFGSETISSEKTIYILDTVRQEHKKYLYLKTLLKRKLVNCRKTGVIFSVFRSRSGAHVN